MALAITSPLQQFFDLDGTPLDDGSLYFGVANQNPETNPIAVYWDAAATQPAAQPVRTMNGYSFRSGSPAVLYVNGDYSLTIRNRKGDLVVYVASGAAVSSSLALQAQITALISDLANTTDPAKGDALIGMKRTLSDAVATTLHAYYECMVIGVKSDYGALGDGSTAETTKLQNAINACPQYGTVDLQGGRYVIDAPLTVATNHIRIKNGKITAAAGSVFEFMLIGNGVTGCSVEDVRFDANRANRTAGQNVRYMGAAWLSSTDCSFIRCTAENAVGYSSIPGVGLTIAGGSIRGLLLGCKLLNCGGSAGTDAADGIFTSGEQNLIVACQAYNCTDTAFVIESSDNSGIVGCTAILCAAAGAITNANASDKRGNYINGLTGKNWDAANTGGIQIGVPTATAGNLLDTRVDGVVLIAETATYGTGAAINVRTAGSGRAIGVTITAPRINGSKNQGILVNGDDVTVTEPTIKNTTDACIQYQGTSTEGEVSGGRLKGGSYGVITTSTAQAMAKGVTTTGQGSGQYYAFGTSVLSVREPVLASTPTAYGNDSGAKIAAATTGREFTITYSASMTPDATLGDVAVITATNGTAFTINAPLGPLAGRSLSFRIRNGSGGALGVATWDAAFALAAWTQPANGFSRTITFKYDGSLWVEYSRNAADIPN